MGLLRCLRSRQPFFHQNKILTVLTVLVEFSGGKQWQFLLITLHYKFAPLLAFFIMSGKRTTYLRRRSSFLAIILAEHCGFIQQLLNEMEANVYFIGQDNKCGKSRMSKEKKKSKE